MFEKATGSLPPAIVPNERKGKDMDKLLTRKEAAQILGISLTTLDLARTEGQISYVQYVENGCVFFTEAGLQEYIARATHRAKPVGAKGTSNARNRIR